MPYSELFRRFSSAIAQPQFVLFSIGYGFGDDHVNSLIRQALAIPSFTLVVVDPAPSSQFAKKLIDANDERVWIVGGWELGTFENFVDKLLPMMKATMIGQVDEGSFKQGISLFPVLDSRFDHSPSVWEWSTLDLSSRYTTSGMSTDINFYRQWHMAR